MAVSITQTANPNGVNSSSNVATYSGVAIGDATANRIVVVLVASELASASINSVTLGGNSMTAGTQGNFGAVYARAFYLAYPTGTTADIVVTYGANASSTQNHIAVYSVTGGVYSSTGADQSSDMDATDRLTTGSITIASGGGFIAVAAGATDGTAKTWANATEDLDVDAGGFRFTTATRTTALTATAVTCTGGTNGEDGALSYLLFTANASPTVALGTPADTATVTDTTPDLIFTGTDTESNDIRYNIQVSTTNTFAKTITVGNTSESEGTTISSLTWSHTVASGDNNFLVVSADIWTGSDTNVTGVTYNGVAMTQGVQLNSSFSGFERNSLWYLANPAEGAHDVVITCSGSTGNVSGGAIDFLGVKQTGQPDAIASVNRIDVTTGSISITTVAEGCAVVSLSQMGQTGDSKPNSPQVGFQYGDGDSTNGAYSVTSYTTGHSAGSVTHGYTSTSGANDKDFVIVAMSLAPADDVVVNAVSGTDSGFTGSPDNSDPFASAQAVTYTVQSALDPGTYYWRVRGIDPSGSNAYGAWATTRSFTISSGTTEVITKDLAYMVRKENSITKALTYKVKTDATIQKGLTYEVDAGVTSTTVTKDLDYTVKTDTAITKGLSYVVTGWYDTNWIYRVKITVDADQVDANLTDFPIYVDLSDLPAGFHTNVKSDGGDIRVTEDDGTTEVPREVVFYNSSTDTGELHFKGDISSTVDTDFYIYYGNSSASDYAIDATYGAENVWKSAYKAVYHLGETVNTTSGGYIDSTANDNDLTGVSMAMTEQAGQLPSKAQEFDGSADYLSGGDILDLGTNDLTISAWIKTTASPSSQFIVSKAKAAAQNYRYGIRTISSGKFSGFMQGDGGSDVIPSGTVTVNDGSFHLVHAVFDRSANLTLYTDSGDATSASISSWDGKNFQSDNPLRVGAYTASDNTSIFAAFDGIIDEVRIVWEALSSTWISTEYNNQSSPSTFFVIGSQEEISSATSVSITKDLAYRVVKDISITKGLAYKIVKDTTVQKTLAYTVKTDTSVTKDLDYKVQPSTAVSKDLDYTVKTDSAITKDLAYSIVDEVVLTKGLTYEVIVTTTETIQKDIDYSIVTNDSIQKDIDYLVVTNTQIQKDLDYTVITEGLVQKGILYEVVVTGVEKVQATLDYTILTNIVAQKDLDYFIITEGTIQKDLTYAVQPSTAITKDSIYTVESQNDTTKDLDYRVVIPDLIQKDLDYFTRVTIDTEKDLVYSVLTTNDNTKTLEYRVINENDIQKDLDYYISITTNTEKDLDYNLQVSTTIQKGVTYSIDVPSILVQKDLDYSIVTTSSTTSDLDYNIVLQDTIQKDLAYNLQATTTVTKGIEYTIISPQSIEQDLQYTITITPSALQKALEYIIVQRTTKQYELRYRVDAPHSISKELLYTIGEKIGIWIKHPGERSDSFTREEGVSSVYTKEESVTASSYTKEESITPSIYTKTEKESSLWTKI